MEFTSETQLKFVTEFVSWSSKPQLCSGTLSLVLPAAVCLSAAALVAAAAALAVAALSAAAPNAPSLR